MTFYNHTISSSLQLARCGSPIWGAYHHDKGNLSHKYFYRDYMTPPFFWTLPLNYLGKTIWTFWLMPLCLHCLSPSHSSSPSEQTHPIFSRKFFLPTHPPVQLCHALLAIPPRFTIVTRYLPIYSLVIWFDCWRFFRCPSCRVSVCSFDSLVFAS